MALDPVIVHIFGNPPDGMDINAQQVVKYNIVMGCMLGLTVIVVGLRIYVRLSRTSLWYDDYAVLVSLVITGATVATTIIAGGRGAGEHIWATTIGRFISLLKVVYAEPFVYATAVTSVKISVLLLYRRMFDVKTGVVSIFHYMFWLASFMTGSYPFILWITMATACKPVSFYWNQYIGAEGSCINVELFFLVLGIVNMINDIIVLAVPIPVILSLHLNPATKVSITGVMMLGGLVCVASIFRIYYLNGLFKNVDATWWMGPSFAWSSIEPLVAIISACLPTLAPLFRFIGVKMTSSGSSGNTPGLSGGGNNTNNNNSRRLASVPRSRTTDGHYRMDEDEIELACNIEANGKTMPSTSNTRTRTRVVKPEDAASSDGEDDRRIRIWTQVSVVSEDKPQR